MDFLRFEEWRHQLDVVLSAPLVLGPLVLFVAAAVAVASWWFAGRLHDGDRRGFDGDRRGFEAELAGIKQQLVVRDERLKLAEERARDQREKREEAERQLALVPPQVWTQLGPSVPAALGAYQASSRVLEQAVIVKMRANEAPDRASFDATVH